MPSTPLTLTSAAGVAYSVLRARMFHFAQGAWIVDLEIAAQSLQTLPLPTGPVSLLLSGTPLKGTVDDASSRLWGPTAKVRVVAGGGGWSKPVSAQQWHADNGVLSTTVYQATGALVGETVVDALPQVFAIDFARAGDSPMQPLTAPSLNVPASAVFRDNPWWLDLLGVTHVGPRLPAAADPSVVLRDYAANEQKITFHAQALLVPGTALVDPRLGAAPVTVYDVEQLFDEHGSIGWAWTQPSAGSSIAGDLKAATLLWTRAPYLRCYRYRLVEETGPGPGGPPTRLALQAVTPSAGMPDLLPLSPWSGAPGVVGDLAPSQEVLVLFENADPGLPRIIGYSLLGGLPLKLALDAQVELDVGPTVPVVNIAGGSSPVALAPGISTLTSALKAQMLLVQTAITALGGTLDVSVFETALVSVDSSTPAKKTNAT